MVCIRWQECCNIMISWSNNDFRYFLNDGENAVWWKDLDQLLGLCCIMWFMLDNCTFNDTSVNTVIRCSFYYEFFLAIFNSLFILGNWLSVNVKGIFFFSIQCNAAMQRWCTLFVTYGQLTYWTICLVVVIYSASKSRCYMGHARGH